MTLLTDVGEWGRCYLVKIRLSLHLISSVGSENSEKSPKIVPKLTRNWLVITPDVAHDVPGGVGHVVGLACSLGDVV